MQKINGQQPLFQALLSAIGCPKNPRIWLLMLTLSSFMPANVQAQQVPVELGEYGANIDESGIQKRYYVNASTGNDNNPGTSESPFGTFSKAMEMANTLSLAQGLKTKIHLANGRYAIPARTYNYRSTSMDPDAREATLIIEGESRGGVILDGAETGYLRFKGKENLVLRNLLLTNCGGRAALEAEEFKRRDGGPQLESPRSRNWRIEYCDFNNNKQAGAIIQHVDRVTMEHCQVKNNFDDGLKYIGRETHFNDILVEGNDKGLPPAQQGDFGNGGFSFASKRSLVENMVVRDNRGAGMRSDFQLDHVRVRNCTFEDNQGGGMIVEVTFGPIEVTNCSIARNNFGVRVSATHNITFDGCKIVDNGSSQVEIVSQLRDQSGECGIDGPPSELDNEVDWHCRPDKNLDGVLNTTIRNSFISAKQGPLYHYKTADNQPDFDWYEGWYKNEFTGENNTYFRQDSDKGFVTDYWTGSTASSRVARTSALSEWQNLTGTDLNSRWLSLSLSLKDSVTTFRTCEPITLTALPQNFPYTPSEIAFYNGSELIGADTDGTDGWSVVWRDPAIGTYKVTAIAKGENLTINAPDTLSLTVEADTTPPFIAVKSTPAVLWASDHRYHTFKLSDFVLSVTDTCAGSIPVSGVKITSVSSDEAELAPGSGRTRNDILIGADCQSVQLRAERQKGGNGRVYTIEVSVTDPSGNQGVATYLVEVPYGSAAQKDAPAYQVSCGESPNSSPLEQLSDQVVSMLGCYPNPFSEQTTIRYSLSQAQSVRVEVYHLTGRKVATLVDQVQAAGNHEVIFNGESLPRGVYLCKLHLGLRESATSLREQTTTLLLIR